MYKVLVLKFHVLPKHCINGVFTSRNHVCVMSPLGVELFVQCGLDFAAHCDWDKNPLFFGEVPMGSEARQEPGELLV